MLHLMLIVSFVVIIACGICFIDWLIVCSQRWWWWGCKLWMLLFLILILLLCRQFARRIRADRFRIGRSSGGYATRLPLPFALHRCNWAAQMAQWWVMMWWWMRMWIWRWMMVIVGWAMQDGTGRHGAIGQLLRWPIRIYGHMYECRSPQCRMQRGKHSHSWYKSKKIYIKAEQLSRNLQSKRM